MASIKLAALSPACYALYLEALCLLLVMPAKPEAEDPYEAIRQLVVAALGREWTDDEPIRFALETLIMMSHALRSEYVLRVSNVDSNDVLYAGNREFKAKGFAFISAIAPKFVGALEKFKSRGVMAAKSKVPALALKAIAALPDVFECDNVMIGMLKSLAGFASAGDRRQFEEVRKGIVAHLGRIFASSESGMQFVKAFSE
jgi:hypothetical protein